MIFGGEFHSVADIIKEFQLSPDALNGKKVLLATYDCGGYDGEAFVVFEENGKLYEVNGGHCSCYGLEDQWQPEETSKAALLMRQNNLYSSEIKADVKRLLESLPD